MSREQPEDPDVSDAARDDWFTETIDSGVVTFSLLDSAQSGARSKPFSF